MAMVMVTVTVMATVTVTVMATVIVTVMSFLFYTSDPAYDPPSLVPPFTLFLPT